MIRRFVYLLMPVSLWSQPGTPAEPVRVRDGQIDMAEHDGRLRPAIGVENIQVLRANRTHPETADNYGWTYNHARMLAYWNDNFYLEYLSNPFGEHVAPGQTLVTTSADGRTWEMPKQVFPIYLLKEAGTAMMHQRMGFYVAPNGRLLVLAFYGQAPNPFGAGGIGRVVREAYNGGSLVQFISCATTLMPGGTRRTQPFPSIQNPATMDFWMPATLSYRTS